MSSEDPRRILDDPSADPLDRSLLERGVNPGPSDATLEVVWRSLSARRAAEVKHNDSAHGSAPQARAISTGRAALVAKAVGVAAFVLGATAFSATRSHKAPPPSATGPSRPLEAPAPSVARTPMGWQESPEPSVEPALLAPVSRPPSSDARTGPRPATPEWTLLQAESDAVIRSRRALRAGECAAALNILADATRRFGAGVLGEERDALGVQALACTGQTVAAKQRAAAFLAAHPASIHVEAMRRLLDGEGETQPMPASSTSPKD
jgi:hypothetical protein